MRHINPSLIRQWFPKRKRDANKGACGRIYIIAGSQGMMGAGVLAAFGAIRAGAGLVRLATARSLQKTAARRTPLEVTLQGLADDRKGTLSARAWKEASDGIRIFRPHVVAAGPGLGTRPGVKKTILSLLTRTPLPVVLDADGLNILAGRKPCQRTGPWIMTPHPGELSRLLNVSIRAVQSDREKWALAAARRYGCVCVLKGRGTLVSDGHWVWKNPTGNAGLATGGTGDVLTGMIAALWGQMEIQSLDTGLKAACVGVYMHGLAGDLAAREKTRAGLIATDVIDYIPRALKKVLA